MSKSQSVAPVQSAQPRGRSVRTPRVADAPVAELRVVTADEKNKQQTEFAANRELEWLRVWSRALKLARLIQDEMDFQQQYSWFFGSFQVDAEQDTVTLDRVTYAFDESFTLEKAKRAAADLDAGYHHLETHREEEERKRREAEQREALRASALAKLTPEERAAIHAR
ncbi:hypothetical protein AB4Y45_32370 [Paraburkholderia sp. EG287A]|uniref:hypothetical protein n=1 Tax=Paraburkholderia sp. EG287A TaxID=3237012 RepID=UPI0034D2AF15